ncbi:hypothetical protein [Litorivivens sp.]|uniref:hypothetical protein n=1 Tax=Litorivivens sp. TaxID=2020868 RepID=UPI00356A6F95
MTTRQHLALLPLAFAFAAVGGNENINDKVDVNYAIDQTLPYTSPVDNSRLNVQPRLEYSTESTMTVLPEGDQTPDRVLEIVIKQRPDQDSYLSVCSEFERLSNGFEVNYDGCLLNTSTSGVANYRLMIPDDTDRLIAVNWRYTETLEPQYSVWERATGAWTLMIE